MIITRITIENYKQYRGEQTFDLAEDATIGVIGPNGVGKTTIFEAIEWCLYKPRGIDNQDIRPRGVGGEVRVALQLTTNDGSRTFEVERILKRSSAQAVIYELNKMGGGEPIVQGTREVTDYITSKLIGLGHAAFVATFFTRQKELSFFGSMRPAERRREVGKLLGLETIKQAQQLIADERSQVRADADSLQRQYDGKTNNRDLNAEIEAARNEIAQHRETLGRAETALKRAEEATAAGEAAVQELQHQRDRHNAITGELKTLEARHQHTLEQRGGITRQLATLDKREHERSGLAESASAEPELRAERARLESERERHLARERLLAEVEGCHRALDQAVIDLQKLIDQAASATDHSGWRWTDADTQTPLEGIDRLRSITAQVDLATAKHHLVTVRSAITENEAHRQEAGKLKKYRDRRQQLHAKLDELMQDGDPAVRRQELDTALTDTRTRRSDAQAAIDSTTKQLDTARELVERLQRQHFKDACPTCGRPFTDTEAGVVIDTLRVVIAQHAAAIASARQRITKAEQDTRQAQQELKDLQARESEIRECRASLNAAKEYIEQQEATVESCQLRLQEALTILQRSTPPSPDDVSAAERDVERARTVKGVDQPLQMLRNTIATTQEAEARHQHELQALTGIQWNPAKYTEVREKHDAAMRAASAIEQIDTELARRPQLEHDIETATSSLNQLTTDIAEQQTALKAVGFRPEALQEASAAYQAARQRERTERETLTKADRAARDAEYRLEALHTEQAQIAELLAQANEKRAFKGELDVMYSEFSEFDKFVAQKQSPLLSETTSDIVSQMTDGKYDRVEFDEDYGIQVYDDTDERFPLETFSGGERDAIALAARLALSRLIGSQAANPPGFLVLDEVFGSLDAERRERVLTLLGQHSSDYFRQMFIVSHLDDVQQSPVFDTIWQVNEQENGSSTVDTGAGEAETIAAG